jgi:hypothetical protein
MNIQILKTTMVGGQLVRAGAEVAASAADARLLIGMGKAIVAAIAAEIAPKPEPVAPKRKTRTKVNTDGDLPANP